MVLATMAAADKPYSYQFTAVGSGTLDNACSFPIVVNFNATFTGRDFYEDGVLTKTQYQVKEQDTFEANGKTLVGLPFSFSVQFLYDGSGATTRFVTNGVAEKVPLPDGRLFISAGKVNWLDHPGVPFVLTVDKGATVNLEGFCAALAP